MLRNLTRKNIETPEKMIDNGFDAVRSKCFNPIDHGLKIAICCNKSFVEKGTEMLSVINSVQNGRTRMTKCLKSF